MTVVALTRLASAASIQGTVVEHLSGRPLARAEVKLASIGAQGAAGAEIKTRANTVGQFLLSGLGVGAYLLSASRPGFAELRYGQKTWKAAGTPIVLAEPASHYVAELRLRRLGAVAGTVWDENQVGLPEQDVVVYEATRPPKMAAQGKTDDRGVYRVGGLKPGRYYVRTRGRMMEDGLGALPTFFKDVAPVEQARTVDVDLDQQTDDVNIQPAFGRLYRIAGQAVAPPRAGPVTVELMSDMGLVSGSVDGAGHFEFDQLAPGMYEITATADAPWREKLGSYTKLSVDKDVDGMRLQLTRAAEFDIQFEEKRGRPIDPKAVAVWARRKSLAGEGPARRIRPQEDALPPGAWELSVTPPPDMYVAVIAGDRGDMESRAANGWKEFLLPGYVRVKVELSSAIAALHGRVTASMDQPAGGAPVFLEPVELQAGTGLIALRTARTDPQGRFRFSGLPPGRYRVLSSFDFDRPGAQDMEAARADEVSLKESSDTNHDLQLFGAP